jgi:hypothetical protein
MRKNFIAIFLGIFFALIILEIFCQIYALYLNKQWKAIKSAPNHYFKASNNLSLGYELASNFSTQQNNRRLWINRFGIREQENEIYDVPKIAILGDSVVFGIGLSQEQTISSLLQQAIKQTGTDVKVLNFGVPGYALHELVQHLKIKDKIYDVDHVFYILNPNDFARRNSIYEGADAGLYRMYCQPLVKSPWFIRKAIYRINKYSGLDDYQNYKASARWYKWLFKGNKDIGYAHIKAMALYMKEKGTSFTVVLLPVGVAYFENGSYGLADMYESICIFLNANNTNYINPTDIFGSNVEKYLDPTDHLTYEGNVLMAKILQQDLENRNKELFTHN